MFSKLKLSTLATSVAVILYTPLALAENAPNYTIEFAQPAQPAPQGSLVIQGPDGVGYPALPTATAQSTSSKAQAASQEQASQRAVQTTTQATMPSAATANQATQHAPNQTTSAQATGSFKQTPAANNALFSINAKSAPLNAGPTQNSTIEMPATSGFNTGTEHVPYEIENLDTQSQQREAALREGVTDQIYPATLNENGTDDFYQSQTAAYNQQQEALKAQGQATLQSYGSNGKPLATGQLNTQQSMTMGANNQAVVNGQVSTQNTTQPSAAQVLSGSNQNTAAQAGNAQANTNQPSFTFEQPEPAKEEKPANLFPLGSYVLTTPDGKQIMVGPDGRPLLDANGQQIPAPLEQLQEVSVMMLTTLDNALINAFKSLESGLTLGLGKTDYQYTVDDIAPAIRGYSFEDDGNLVVRFSVNAAERIIKSHGSLSWNGLSNPILVWMVGADESKSGKLSLVSGQNLSRFAQAILNAAPDYKYRLMFPILDLEDVQKVKVNTVLNHDDFALAAASERYGADYFIAAAIDSIDNTGVALKWNLYNRKGEKIAQSALTGLLEEVASLGAGDIARAVMTYQEERKYQPQSKEPNQTTDSGPAELTANNVDIERLGAGDGFIRIRVENVRALRDFNEIRKAFVTYGYDGDIRVVGYDGGAMILELVTNSNIINLEGTIRRAGDFTYLAPWTYRFNSTSAPNSHSPTSSSNSSYNTPQNVAPSTGATNQYPNTNAGYQNTNAGYQSNVATQSVSGSTYQPTPRAYSQNTTPRQDQGSPLIIRGE